MIETNLALNGLLRKMTELFNPFFGMIGFVTRGTLLADIIFEIITQYPP